MGAASMQALRGLQHLTALHLPYCGVQGLPAGPYLTGMKRCAELAALGMRNALCGAPASACRRAAAAALWP